MKTRYTFESDIKAMAESCVGNKPATARKKASALYYSYGNLFAYDEKTINRQNVKISSMEKAIECLRSDKLQYKGGFIKISDVVHVERKPQEYLLMLSGGRQVQFETYLFHELFELIFDIKNY